MRCAPLVTPVATITLLALFAASAARAAWPTNPAINVPVSVASEAQARPAGAPDSCGGMILAWLDYRSISGQPLVYVQRMDAFGQPRWTLNGFAIAPTGSGSQSVPTACSDGSGGAFVTWAEQRLAVNGQDVYVQHVLSTGIVDPAWPVDGLLLTDLPANQGDPVVVADGVGGAIVVWSDNNGGNVDLRDDLYAQRVSPAGAMIWAVNGVPLVAGPGDQNLGGSSQYDHGQSEALASDGGGGVIAVWQDFRTGVPQTMAQRLSGPTGTPMWTAGGVVVAPTGINQIEQAICVDGARAIFVWADYRNGFYDVYAQALSPGGAPLWAPGGIPVCTASHQLFPFAVTDGLGGAIIAWRDVRSSGYDVYAQRLDASGAPLWTANGVALCTAANLQSPVDMISDDRFGAIVAWTDGRAGSSDVYAQRVSSTGTPLWTVDGQVVSNAFGIKRDPVAVSDGAGGVVSAWQDERNYLTSKYDLYAQQVGATGLVGVRAASKNCMPDICGYAYVDFGDAPEGTAAYVSGSPGHFPTCLAPGSAGTQEVDCGAALSTSPGPTGFVRHDGTNPDTPSIGLGCAPSNSLGHAVVSYQANLNGPNVPNASPGVGVATVDIDFKAHTMHIHATYSGLLGTSTASHIHAATAVAMTGNAGVATMTPCFAGFPLGVTAGTYDGTFDMTLASSYNPTFVTSHGGTIAQAESDLFQSFADGKAYFDIHSTAFAGGEIRGFLVPTGANLGLAVDTELDGTVNAVGAPPAIIPSETSTCSPAVAIYEYERGGGGLWFGADEIEGDGDAGIAAPKAVLPCAVVILPYKAWSCGPSTIAAYLNVLVDWSLDGDWNDVVSCGAGTNTTCVPEWAVKNAQVQLAPGCNSLLTPSFSTGPTLGQPWMRVTLTLAPVTDEFPWAGSANVPGGSFAGGETEDYPLTVATGVLAVDDVAGPSVLTLGAVRPNPMREAAEFQFSLARAGRASLDVYDLAGRRVRSVAAGMFSAGRHVARWDGTGDGGALAPSGFYFARLTSDGRTITRPLIRLN
jgi:CHRD domain/FlgD Ig-like domain